ncbi:6557_t:CDS:2 [Scutellospora calospora]|uniref:6557_t:CDS:1 n=1 Tax=Scutellospora calospora TaxID=85575 RepID=A0ACA9KKZ6_9GLOM|nr:6557_t:CDS:2 [Scutellospora calospora]
MPALLAKEVHEFNEDYEEPHFFFLSKDLTDNLYLERNDCVYKNTIESFILKFQKDFNAHIENKLNADSGLILFMTQERSVSSSTSNALSRTLSPYLSSVNAEALSECIDVIIIVHNPFPIDLAKNFAYFARLPMRLVKEIANAGRFWETLKHLKIFLLSDNEWDTMEVLVEILQPFAKATDYLEINYDCQDLFDDATADEEEEEETTH